MIARTFLRCGGALRVSARFCTTLALTCQVCSELYRQSVPPAVAVALATTGVPR